MLDSVHSSALRLATGAFRSSPVSSLLAESGEPSLHYRRVQLMANYLYSLKSKPDSPSYNPVFDSDLREKYVLKPRAIRPFGVRIPSLLSDLGVPNLSVKELNQCDIPPWSVNNVVIDLSLNDLTKASTQEEAFRLLLSEKINSLRPCDVVYTDGSKGDLGTGCAFVTSSRDYKFNLPPVTSIYTAELTAILKALNIVCPLTRRLVVCSDSLSSLLSVQDLYSKHILVREIYAAIHQLGRREIEVVLIWAPGHVGIHGNELADRAAKEAIHLPLSTNLVIAGDVKSLVKKCIKQQWSNEWFATVNNKLRTVKDTVTQWATSCRGRRREEVVLCRLRIGHTTLTHGFLMNRGEPPLCDECNEVLTVDHVLTTCNLFDRERRACRLASTVAEILGDNEVCVGKIFNFLAKTRLVSRI